MASGSSSQGSTQQGEVLDFDLSNMDKDEILELLETLRLQDSETNPPDPRDDVPNWLQVVDGKPAWLPTKDYAKSKFCLNCHLDVAMLVSSYKKRDTPEFKWQHLREVNTLYHIDPSRMNQNYTPKTIMESAVEGCPLCALAVGTSWFRGDVPFDSQRWVQNPLWRKRAQFLLRNLYKVNHWVSLDKEAPKALLELVYGTNLNTDMWPEADFSEFWGSIHYWDNAELKRWYDLHSSPYKSLDTLGKPPFPTICPTTGDTECLELAKWWLKRCLAEHHSCTEAATKNEEADYPTRLLYVGAESESEKARIVITKDEIPPKADYITLSYCWGTKPFTRLTTATLEDFRKEIKVDSLPATFQDAIKVTRYLGYSYIWIDALCIIQDVKDDWRNESAKMGSIYRGSILTITALGAASCFEGCFMARNPCCYQDIPLSNSEITITSRTPSPDGQPSFKREFEVNGHAASPVKTRAWCVQEELLSPRTLYYGSSGMFWQCIECEADEGYPLGTLSHENLKSVVHRSTTSSSLDIWSWRAILERYTGCKLTYATDKLIAISGIADVLSRATGEEMVHGLWKNHLWRELLWHSALASWAENAKCQRLENESPSFSWASVGQAIYHFKYDHPSRTSLVAKSAEMEEETMDGKKICRIRLKTQIREVVLLPPIYSKTGAPTLMLAEDVPEPEQMVWSVPEVPNAVIIRLLNPIRHDWTIDKKHDEDMDTSELHGFVYDWVPDIPLDGSITRAWFMCLTQLSDTNPLGAAGLIIVPTDQARTTWKRIGFLHHGGFPDSWIETGLRVTVQNTETDEVDWVETAKHRAPNPFLADSERDWVEVVLV
jgi:hypothetical protein